MSQDDLPVCVHLKARGSLSAMLYWLGQNGRNVGNIDTKQKGTQNATKTRKTSTEGTDIKIKVKTSKNAIEIRIPDPTRGKSSI